jgi:hypothetical protein
MRRGKGKFCDDKERRGRQMASLLGFVSLLLLVSGEDHPTPENGTGKILSHPLPFLIFTDCV